MKQSLTTLPTASGIPILPTVLKDIEPQIAQHRQDLEELQRDILSRSESLRGFLSQPFFTNRIRLIDVDPDPQEVHAVDCATLTVTAGEFTSLLALGVNVSDRNPSWFKRSFIQICAPNSDAFGSSNTPFAALAEMQMLDEVEQETKCFYDGSFQSLNYNLGNFFEMLDPQKLEHSDFGQYIPELQNLFDSVVNRDPKRNYTSLYSRVFNSKRTDLIAVSKRSSSSYIITKLREMHQSQSYPQGIDSSLVARLQFKQTVSDKLLLHPVLKAGEVFGPLPFSDASGKQGLRTNAQGEDQINDKARKAFFDQLNFVFYRPHEWSPVYRIEYVTQQSRSKSASKSKSDSGKEVQEQELREILAIVKHQTRIVGILEIEAIYLADKVSKQVIALKDIYGYSNFRYFPDLFSPNRTEEI